MTGASGAALHAQAGPPGSQPPVLPARLPGQPADGAKIFAATCLACHQATGQGVPNQFPPLVGSEWVLGNEERLVRIILHGVVGEIEVEGETFNGAMPTWGPLFKDDEVAAVATYVRSAWGNKAAPVVTATVTRVRARYATRTTPWTVRDLQESGGRP
jgi:mono/diheme cytochrome c family protein